jgi:CheY-like chemotaxis protein
MVWLRCWSGSGPVVDMMNDCSELTPETFTRLVQDALGRIYDGAYLRTHPLAHLLVPDAAATASGSQSLRRVLVNAMRLLHPADGVSAQSPAWRIYRILELRYLDGLPPGEVMQQLGLGKSQYFHEQARAVEALGAVLWEHRPPPETTSPAVVHPETTDQVTDAEIERLFGQALWEPVDLLSVLQQLRTMVDSIASAKRVDVSWVLEHPLIALYADRVLLRQAFLHVISVAIDHARGGTLAIATYADAATMGIRIRIGADALQSSSQGGGERSLPGLELSRRFMAAMGGTVEVDGGPSWEARLVWPTSVQRLVLVVDDNVEFVELFRRYLGGHGWQVVGATDAAEARLHLTEIRPQVIILDVMMPREDGWELLTALKADPAIRDIPVVVCSVLHERELALVLGAAAYLPKPVTQQELLAILTPLTQAGATLGPASPTGRSRPA